MARQIDDSKPLSAEDRAFLASRNRYDEIDRIDRLHGDTKPDAPEPILAPPIAAAEAAVGTDLVRLGNYLIEHFPSEVPPNRFQNGEGAVDTAIRVLDRSLDAPAAPPAEEDPADTPVETPDQPSEQAAPPAQDAPVEQHEGTAEPSSEGASGESETPAPQEPVVDGTTAQDLGLDTNPQQVAETPEQRPAQMSEARTADTYADWTNDELREELAKRELSKSGIKDELIARLREDDAA